MSSVQTQSVFISSNKNSTRGGNDTSLTISQGNVNQNVNLQIRQSLMNKKLGTKLHNQPPPTAQYYDQTITKQLKHSDARAAAPVLRSSSAQSKEGSNVGSSHSGKLRISTSATQNKPGAQPDVPSTAKVGRVNVLAAGPKNPYDQMQPESSLHSRQGAAFIQISSAKFNEGKQDPNFRLAPGVHLSSMATSQSHAEKQGSKQVNKE